MVLSFFLFPLVGAEKEELHLGDIPKVMDQILSQHVETKAMTPELLQRALKNYVDQLDPDRVYFLEEEVHPFLACSPQDLSRYLAQYQHNDFSIFYQLNALGQQAILRSRQHRSEVESDFAALYAAANQPGALEKGLPSNPAEPLSFAQSEKELRDRQRDALIRFVAAEIKQFGAKLVQQQSQRVIALYERQARLSERGCLFEDGQGAPLASREQENLFVLHVLKALASSLDAHTAFFNEEEAYDMRVHLEKSFQGIGVVLQEGLDGVIITRLIDNSPAARSGKLQVNDRILEINGKSIVDEPFLSVLDLIRGGDNTAVTLRIKRIALANGQEKEKIFDLTLNREPIAMNEDRVKISFDPFEDGIIGKITLYSFYESDNGISSENDIRDALKKLNAEGRLKGLVLDLRENTGGFLNQAVKVVGLFISNGVVVISKYSNGEEKIYRDLDNRVFFNGPMVVLTSKMTASAAEIVAESLQDWGVALVVGDDHTYGKGSIQHQTVTEKNSSSFFKVTVGKYYTPSGRTPQIQGVKADIVLPSMINEDYIGEKYLAYSLTSDTISSYFDDNLQDISPQVKEWYQRYYLPSLQKRDDRWQKVLPLLKEKSAERMGHNAEYQALIEAAQNPSTREQLTPSEDFQLEEAVNIVKDMILLDHPKTSGGKSVLPFRK